MAHANISLTSLSGADPLPPYVRLIHDVLLGDRSLFTRPDGLAAVWDVAEPLLSSPPQVRAYAPGSWGPAQAARPDRARALAPRPVGSLRGGSTLRVVVFGGPPWVPGCAPRAAPRHVVPRARLAGRDRRASRTRRLTRSPRPGGKGRAAPGRPACARVAGSTGKFGLPRKESRRHTCGISLLRRVSALTGAGQASDRLLLLRRCWEWEGTADAAAATRETTPALGSHKGDFPSRGGKCPAGGNHQSVISPNTDRQVLLVYGDTA